MNFQLFFKFKLRLLSLFIFTCILNSLCIAQSDLSKSSKTCKYLAIQCAQLADKSHFFSQKSYFEKKPFIIENYADSAILFIKESILFIDSALVLASDSLKLGIKYAHIARNFANNCYLTLIQLKNSNTLGQKKELLQKALFYSANTTVDAYHASFYLTNKVESEKKEELPKIIFAEKIITKLDIDQTLFTLLKENLNEKSEVNKQDIIKLASELSNTKDPDKALELKSQLKSLELQGKDFDKKNNDAQVKLSAINTLIENRDKNGTTVQTQKDTIFTKSIAKKNDEWNNPDKFVTEIPDDLVYQVQLGVFKNVVQIDKFKGFTPIYSNETETGITYSTGLFKKLTDAQEAKKTIQSMGLTEAFIIAYYNKKKITLDKAIKLEK